MCANDREKRAAELGYAPLCLDIIQSELATKRLGTKFHYFQEIDSTNSYARRLADAGAPEGAVVIAEHQSDGRGRLGRSWESPPYCNLYFSLLLRPTLAPAHAPQITLMAAVALADTVAEFIVEPPAIKWPNDILLQGKKLAGILTESSCDAKRIEFVILGIGVNLNFPRERMPETIRDRATSLMEVAGNSFSRELVLRRLIQDLDRCYGTLEDFGFDAIAPRWQARFGLKGKTVRVEMGGDVLIGQAVGIDRDGALLVEDDRGERQRVVAGDVTAIED
ncbi:MAG: biotin--[acetyl-CoA-carboxylase] ligase [Deltaproteobacteria bacterium]|nr:biotin--[acetyl-CoA-carboxylase] ligase [Deltaproteobacteria bacterium]